MNQPSHSPRRWPISRRGNFPYRVVSDMSKILRRGKVLIDWSQNSDFKTTVCVYAMWAKAGGPFISMPLDWDELAEAVKRRRRLSFTPSAAIRRIGQLGDLFEPVLSLKQELPRAFTEAIAAGPPPRLLSWQRKRNRGSGLDEYAARRNYAQTPEPAVFARAKKGERKGSRRFVIQKLGLEGVVGKRLDTIYEPGQRSGAWIKYRTNMEQEFVIGGYLPGARGFDALLVGVYEKKELMFVAKVKNGFVRRIRDELLPALKALEIAQCPFKNLPEKRASRWGESLTVEKMEQCRWLKPKLVCQVAFVEWTDAGHLRHCTFVGLRDDKRPAEVVRET